MNFSRESMCLRASVTRDTSLCARAKKIFNLFYLPKVKPRFHSRGCFKKNVFPRVSTAYTSQIQIYAIYNTALCLMPVGCACCDPNTSKIQKMKHQRLEKSLFSSRRARPFEISRFQIVTLCCRRLTPGVDIHPNRTKPTLNTTKYCRNPMKKHILYPNSSKIQITP